MRRHWVYTKHASTVSVLATIGATNSWIGQSNAQVDVTTVNIEGGLLYPYNKSALIYVCPADTYMITWTGANSAPGRYPQTRFYAIDFAPGGGDSDDLPRIEACTVPAYSRL